MPLIDPDYLRRAALARINVGMLPAVPSDYDTKLDPEQEAAFQAWKAQYAPRDSGEDYDLRGAFRSGFTPDPETGHFPDLYKKPNHPTFSDQSQYAIGNDAARAGHWLDDNATFVPPMGMLAQDNLDQMARDRLNVGLLPATRLAGDITSSPGANVAPAEAAPTAEGLLGPYDMANKFVGARDPQARATSDTGATGYQDLVNRAFARIPTTPGQMREAMGGMTGNPMVDLGAPFAAYSMQGMLGQGAQLADTASEAARGYAVSHPNMALFNALGLPLVGKSPRAPVGALTEDALRQMALDEGKASLPFFSRLYETVNKFPDKMKAGGAQLLGQLRNAGVKDDELLWSGFEDWAKRQDKPISKTDALDYLEQNLMQIEETVNETRPARFASVPLQDALLKAPIPPGDIYGHGDATQAFNDSFVRQVTKDSGLPDDDPFLMAFKAHAAQMSDSGRPLEPFSAGQWHRDYAKQLAADARREVAQELYARAPEIATLPENSYERSNAVNAARQAHPDLDQRLARITEDEKALSYWDYDRPVPTIGNTKWNSSTLALGSEYADRNSYKEMKIKLRMPPDRPLKPGEFLDANSQTHWGDEKNILFHVRFDTRTDPETGRKLLFIHELQSDWGQGARRIRNAKVASLLRKNPEMSEAEAEAAVPATAGFHDPAEIEKLQTATDQAKKALNEFMAKHGMRDRYGLEDEIWRLSDERNRLTYEASHFYDTARETSPQALRARLAPVQKRMAEIEGELKSKQAAQAEMRRLAEQHSRLYHEYQNAIERPGLPLGPYIDKTDKWTELAMKRMLHYATEHGYDDIGWTPGIVQTYRNHKRAMVDKITWNAHTGALEGRSSKDPHGGVIIGNNVYPQNIHKYVSPENATKLRSQIFGGNEYATIDVEPTVVGDRSGNFYDQTILNNIRTLAKKYNSKPHPFGTHKIKVADKAKLKHYLQELRSYVRADDREKMDKLIAHPTLEGIKEIFGDVPYILGRYGINETNVGWENIVKRKSPGNDQTLYQPIMSLPITPEMHTKLRSTGFPLSLAGGLGLEEFLRQQGITGEDDGRS